MTRQRVKEDMMVARQVIAASLAASRDWANEKQKKTTNRWSARNIISHNFTGVLWNFFGNPLTFVLNWEEIKKSQESGRSTKHPKNPEDWPHLVFRQHVKSFWKLWKQWEIFKNVRSMCRWIWGWACFFVLILLIPHYHRRRHIIPSPLGRGQAAPKHSVGIPLCWGHRASAGIRSVDPLSTT